jgi:dephospho-CoA kinase
MCDEIWFVYADPEIRISRLSASRGYSREKSISIIENQLSDEAFTAYADYIVDNSGSKEETAERIGELLCGL